MPKRVKKSEVLSKLISFRISQNDSKKLKHILTVDGKSKTGFFRSIIKEMIQQSTFNPNPS